MRVLLLPGLDGTSDMLGAFTNALSVRSEVVPISYPCDQLLTYPELAEFVARMLPEDEPFALIAESFSGPVAALLAAQRPEKLRAVVFAASFVCNPTRVPKMLAWLGSRVPFKLPWLLKLARPFTFGRWGTADLDELLLKAVHGIPMRTLSFRLQQVLQVDELEQLKRICVPVLYIRPTDDKLVSGRMVAAMKAANAKLIVEEIEGPHFVLQVNAQICAQKVSEFLVQRAGAAAE